MQRRMNNEEHFNFPPTISEEILRTCVEEFKDAVSSRSLMTAVCGICGIDAHKITLYNVDQLPNAELLKPWKGEQVLSEYDHFGLILVSDGIVGNQVQCCNSCQTNLEANKLPPCSAANNLQTGKPPPEMNGLTIGEKLLIGIVRPSVHIVKFKEVAGPGSDQRGIRGNTIVFPQDVSSISRNVINLPHDVDDMCEYLKVVFVGSRKPSKRQLMNVLQVRRQKVAAALKWLTKNHLQYQNVKIDSLKIRKLPQKKIPECIWETIVHDLDTRSEEIIHGSYTNASIEDVMIENQTSNVDDSIMDVVMEQSGVIDVDGSTISSMDQMKVAAGQIMKGQDEVNVDESELNANEKIHIIPHGPMPIVEYDNPDLWTGAYPWNFPYGLGGPEGRRKVNLSLRLWIKHLIQLHTPTFRMDQMFYFHVFNVIQKREVSLQASICVRQPRFQDGVSNIANLKSKQLEKSLTSIAEGKITDPDPNVKSLMSGIHVVGGKVPGSPYKRRNYRLEIQGNMIKLGQPAFYVTLNPADIHSPIVSFLSGAEIDLDEQFPSLPSAIDRARMAANNPVCCAKYFDIVIQAFITCLLRFRKKGGGILGDVSAYYGCPEEQGRGALHMHMLIWIHGYSSPSKLREEMNSCPEFKEKMLSYLESVIKQNSPFSTEVPKNDKSAIDTDMNIHEVKAQYKLLCEDTTDNEGIKTKILTQSAPDPDSKEFSYDMDVKAHLLIQHCCIHRHNTSCRKYGNKHHNSQLREKEKQSEKGNQSERDDQDECSNQDEKHNQGDKGKQVENWNQDDCRYGYPRKFIMKTELDGDEIHIKRLNRWVNNYERTTLVCLKCNHDVQFIGSGKDANAAAHYITDYQCKTGMNTHNTLPMMISITKRKEIGDQETYADAFTTSRLMLTRMVNKIITNREMSGQHVASLLLRGEDKYSSHSHRMLNILSYLSHIDDGEEDMSLELQSKFQTDEKGIILLNDVCDYLFRGSDLAHLSLYKYTMLIEKVTLKSQDNIGYQEDGVTRKGRKANKRYQFDEQHPQYKSHIQRERTTEVIPRLTWLPPSENGNKEKFSKCMILLFKPFSDFNDLKERTASWTEEFENSKFDDEALEWIENIREMHLGIIRKAELNEEKREENMDEDDDEDEDMLSIDYDYYLASDDEFNDSMDLGSHIFSNMEHDSKLDHSTSEGLDILSTAKFGEKTFKCQQYKARISRTVSNGRVKSWKQHMDECKKNQTINNNFSFAHCLSASNYGNPENWYHDNVHCENSPSIAVLDDVIERFSLNEKQRKAFLLVGKNVINRMNGRSVDQILLHLGGAGGTGKTRVIEALVYLHDILNIRFSIKLAAYTGTAAAAIGGNTLSSLAQIARHSNKRADVKKLEDTWGNVNLLIIDEVSLISCPLLATLHRNLVKGKHNTDTAPFAQMDVVFSGHFNQFPPVKSVALYYGTHDQTETKPLKFQTDVDRELGRSLWGQLTHVIILTEQNRIKDQQYKELLDRVAEGTCTFDDYTLLNTRVIGNINLDEEKFRDAPVIVPGNCLRKEVNTLFALHKALALKQNVILSIAKDVCSRFQLSPSKLKSLRHLPYTNTGNLAGELELFVGMTVMLTVNLAVESNLSNGSIGKISRIASNRKPVFKDGRYILTDLPSYVVVKFSGTTCTAFEDLNDNEVPIFPQISSFSHKFPGCSRSVTIRRQQLPIIPCYAYTSYKAQGKTLPAIITDLVPPKGFRNIDSSFSYVPLSRIQRLTDLVILRKFPFSVLQKQRPLDLIAQDRHFAEMDCTSKKTV